MKRISFNKYETEHLYELSLEHFQYACPLCEILQERIEKFIGKEALKIKRMIKKRGYCNKLVNKCRNCGKVNKTKSSVCEKCCPSKLRY